MLIAAFSAASLLTTSAVARRVRELGTLKALGWQTRRIILQILAETAVMGALGAALGVVIGFAGITLINALAPSLTATVAQNPGSSPAKGVTISGSTLHETTLPDSVHTVAVHLHVPFQATMVTLAVALAIAGALIAGALAAWRATRLSPREALAKVT